MSQVDTPAAVQSCALRLARLAVDGTTPAGANNGYVTQNLIKLTVKPEIEGGQEFTVRDACGGLPVLYKDRDIIKRYAADLELVYPDPELAELLVAAPLITGTIGTTRTVANASITSGSDVLSSPTIAFVASDVGNIVSATGITVGTTILQVISPTSARMSAPAIATTSGSLSVTITAGVRSLGVQAPALGITPTDFGVSLELWSKAVIGNSQVPVNPWIHWAYPKSVWQPADRDHANERIGAKFTGFLYENPGWGNGPWNDWADAGVPSTATLSRAWGWHRTPNIPTSSPGYTAVPTQV